MTRTQAIVLKGMRFNESSKIVTLYTKSFGKISVLVKGVRSAKSGMASVFDNMNHIELYLRIKESRDLQVVNKAECIESYDKIKSDIEKIATAYKIIEMINKVSFEYDKNENLFFLIQECLRHLNNNSADYELLYIYFQVFMLDHLGMNILSKLSYDILSDQKGVNTTDDTGILFNENTRKFLKEISETKFENISKLRIEANNKVKRNISTAMNGYILRHYHKFGLLVSEGVMNKLTNQK